MSSKTVDKRPSGDVTRETGIKAAALDLLERIPDAGSDGLGIVERILSADLEDLTGEQQDTVPIEDLYNKPLIVSELSKVQSSYSDTTGFSLGYYGVLRGVDSTTGQSFVTTTSGVSVLLTLARFYPAHMPVTIVLSERRTNNGYDVQNIAVLDYAREAISV